MEASLERSIGNEIRVLSNMIHRTLANMPGTKQIEAVTGNQRLDHRLYRPAGGQQRISERSGTEVWITRSTASKVVNLMVQKGLIVREKVPGDARLKKLVLTDRSL